MSRDNGRISCYLVNFNHCVSVIFTGSLRTEHTPVFRLLGDFETARWPAGATRCINEEGWNLTWRSRPSLNFTPLVQGLGC